MIEKSGPWTVTAAQEQTTSGEYSCPFQESLNSLGANYESAIDGFFSLFEKFSQLGKKVLNNELCHEVDSNNKIFEFIKGDLRLLWFYGSGNKVIICSHIFIKKRQKTPELEKRKAINIKNNYMKAVSSGKTIEIFEED